MDNTEDVMLARSFPVLINALVERHHEGNLLAMCQASRIPYTTLWRWQRGLSRRYDFWNVQRLCDHYELNQRDVWDLIHQDIAALSKRDVVELPDLSDVKRGPVPRTAQPQKARGAKRRRGLGHAIALILTVACSTSGALHLGSDPTDGVSPITNSGYYVNWRRWLARFCPPWPWAIRSLGWPAA